MTYELVYSTQRSGFEKGRHYQNPRYFERVKPDVTHVYILGNWPKVKNAYEDAGVNVTELPEGVPISWTDGAAPEHPAQELVEITKQWKKWGWPRLQDTAQRISGHPVANKRQAILIIEGELERRRDEQPDRDPPDEDNSPDEE